MKKVFLVFSCLLCLSFSAKAQFYFETDFTSDEMWEQFTTYDLDGFKPYYNNWGTTPPYKAWVRLKFDSKTTVAASTSWYNPSGAANDWLVSPAITLPAGAKDVILAWDGVAYDPDFRDGYKVYISTTGKEVSDFSQPAVFSIDHEQGDVLKRRSISLSEYAGKTIYVAWVNDSYDKFVLGITNIAVFSNIFNFTFTTELPPYLSDQSEYTIKGSIQNQFSPITSFTAYYLAKGTTHSQQFDNVNIATGATFNFQFNDKLSVAPGESVPYQVWVVAGGQETEKQSKMVARVAEAYPRKIVGEEGTGTWCGWCPRGTVSMAEAKEKYPETLIVIAAHEGDPMEVSKYISGLKFGAYPNLRVNRLALVDPIEYQIGYDQFINRPTPAKIKLSAQYTDETKQKIAAKIKSDFTVNYNNTANFKVSIIVTENDVKGTDSKYAQANFYSGGAYGPMGGFENMPNPVPADKMVYQDVARALIGPFAGIAGSVPSTLAIGTPEEFDYTFDLPATIGNKDKIEVIAVLIDSNTGEIMNADRVLASEITVTSMKEIQLTGLTVNAYKNSPETVAIQVETESTKQVSIDIYGLDAKLVKTVAPATVAGSHQFIVPTNGLKGIHLIMVKADKQVVTTKVMF